MEGNKWEKLVEYKNEFEMSIIKKEELAITKSRSYKYSAN